jgi:hypothetical protein
MEFGSGSCASPMFNFSTSNGFEVASVTHGDPLVIRRCWT